MTAHPAARIALHRIVLGLAVLLGGLVLLAPLRTGVATLFGEGSSFATRMISEVQGTDPVANQPPDFNGVPGVSDAWWSRTQADLARAEYGATLTSAGLQAPNRAHNLRTTFGERGIAVVPRTGKEVVPAWRFAWEASGIGRCGRMEAVAPASPEASGARVTYRRNGWSEWYENTPKGIEQGFTIERKPAGEGRLLIAGDFPPALRAEVADDGAIDFIDPNGVRVLRYGELKVWDARGTELAAELQVVETTLTIAIDDRNADYPLLVDPLLTSPAWTIESNQAVAMLGFSVGTAGDVNGDGFSDVIVGAWLYDNGQTDEGRAFVYHGSPSGLNFAPNWTAESDRANARFGYTVSTAGDVNGDGFSDVVVAAVLFANGQVDEGRAFVYHGSASGLSTTPQWTAEGDQVNAQFGFGLATAGDVNGDGFGDVIVSSQYFDNGETDEGRAFVYHGSATGLSATANWTAESNQTSAALGSAVATAGDVNGDGFSDVIVGAWLYDNGQTDEGRVFVYHGSGSGLSLTSNWSVESNQASSFFGVSVAGAGDVNGDGFADVLIGAQGFDNGQSSEGRAFAYHGGSGGLGATPAWTKESDLADASYGHAVATAGDVNGDGYADVIVGAPNVTNGQAGEGRVYVYHGSRLGLATIVVWTAESNQIGANLGIAVGPAGDVNGDGFSDVITGAWSFDNGQSDEGRAFVYHGSAGGPMVLFHWGVEGDQAHALLGSSVAAAGDVNGDGYGDVVVGAPSYDNGTVNEGRAFVYHGSANGVSFTPNWTAESNQDDAHFGSSVASAGDVNGDGFADLIVGAPNFNGGQLNEGRAFIYHGSAGGLAASPAWIAESNQEQAGFGISVATAGDVNGDGFADVIVGAQEFDNGELDEGRAFVYHGSMVGLASTPAWTAESNRAFAAFGSSVATAGDVNGDGFSDVIVGANLLNNGQQSQGRAFAYHGSTGGLGTTPTWFATGDRLAAHFGMSVGTAGDVNGDGYSDAIVGAPASGFEEGAVHVFHGSATGLSIANWMTEGDQDFGEFGNSVSTAGDVNGDGYSDVIIGASSHTNGQDNEGAAFVYRGSSIGLSSAPALAAEINQESAHFGSSVATAGDVNGDGFSDLIVGASGYDGGQPNGGLAVIYYGNENQGLARIARQSRTDDSALISPLGLSDSGTAFRLKVLGRTAGGRGRVRLQFEVKPFGVPFDGSGLANGGTLDTGAPSQGIGSVVPLSELAAGLVPETLYHWRLRTATDSPFFPRSPWLTLAGNNVTEADLRTGAATVGVADQEAPEARLLLLDPVRPNPLRAQGEIAYTLPDAGEVRLTVVDVAGRVRAVIASGAQTAGRHRASWDARDAEGRTLPAGVYLIRLEAAGRETTRKLVLAR